MIHTRSLKKTFSYSGIETSALNSVNLEIREGEFVAIMGPSGCGKSTLLNILGLLDQPSSGEYLFNGVDVCQLKEKQRSLLRKENIGFVFQNFNLIEELSVFENVELPLTYLGINAKRRRERVEEVLDSLKIAYKQKELPRHLSGGQQQRVAVARAIVANPKLLLADEPTGNLDSMHGDELMNLLKDLNETGTTIVMVTHSQRDADFSQRLIRLFDGQIVSENMR